MVVIWFGLASGGCFSLFEAKKLTFGIFELKTSVLHVNRSEFHQEFNGDGPRHMIWFGLASGGCFSLFEAKKLTFDIFELKTSVLHVNR